MEEEEEQEERQSDQQPTYRTIRRLDESVINRIAAGEIIHRPANALKELIENSLDAGATMIKVTLKDGGIKTLQIQDNGSGIRHSDLALLCERFATSKLNEFSDLSNMSTFGFRGEALASISYVTASMHVVSKTRDQDCAYKAYYASGALVPHKPGQTAEPKQCAGTDGTLIIAQDLFYNVPQRRMALKNAADEYNRALDVISKYAVHCGGRGIGFVCKKASSNMTDISTPSSPTTTTLDLIRLIHGHTVARELVEFKAHRNEKLGYSCQGWISGANWSSKRTTMLCFINNRLVDCPALKRSLETLYSTLLPKGGHPWMYISLSIDPANVDVNVHPTKKEVHFLNEDEIVQDICDAAQTFLAGANSSRTFAFTQAVLPGATPPSTTQQQGSSQRLITSDRDQPGSETRNNTGPVSSQKGYPQHLVRVDAKTRTLDSMFTSLNSVGKRRAIDDFDSVPPDTIGSRPLENARKKLRIMESECSLTSIKQLRAEIVKDQHRGLTEIVQNHVFVGIVDVDRGLSLIQHDTRLYLVHHESFIEEFAYQLCIKQFGSFKRIQLDPPPSLEELIQIGIRFQPDIIEKGLDQDQLTRKIVSILKENAELLNEYFSIRINLISNCLETIPCVLPHHIQQPSSSCEILTSSISLERLPIMLTRLVLMVNWKDELQCFKSIAKEIAKACIPFPSTDTTNSNNWEIQYRWFETMSFSIGKFVVSKKLLEKHVLQVAHLPDLYKVFERC